MPAAVESGPAAGVIAAQRLGDQIGRANLISFDMGGTTAKASLIENGRIETTSEYEVGGQGNVGRWLHGTGHPIRVPVIDLAGGERGGRQHRLDRSGRRAAGRTGSAGAEPGPACYGYGGDRPTVTDANVVLGSLSRTHLLGGRLPIDAAAAEAAVRAHVADPLGQGIMEAAAGIVSVVNHGRRKRFASYPSSAGTMRASSAWWRSAGGPRPRRGARRGARHSGGHHPPDPGRLLPLGLVATDLRRDWSHTFYSPIESIDLNALNQRSQSSNGRPRPRSAAQASRSRIASSNARRDCRYAKQAYELTVPLAGGTVTRETLDTLAREFHAQHLRTYGHENPNESVQMVNVRVTATGRLPRVEFHAQAAKTGGDTPGAAQRGGGRRHGGRWPGGVGARRGGGAGVWFGEPVLCPVIGRHDLASGRFRGGADAPPASAGIAGATPGPFIVEEMDCTVVVPPGWSATLDERGFILMARNRRYGNDSR